MILVQNAEIDCLPGQFTGKFSKDIKKHDEDVS